MKKEQLIAVYDNHDDAAEAIEALLKAGVSKEDISVLGKGEGGEPKDDFELNKENEDIAYWGKQGAFWGALWGFLMGAFFFFVPGFGPLVATGPVIASLAGALGGAAVVGGAAALIAWFKDLGVEEVEAHRYADLLKEGKTLVVVHGEAAIQKARPALEALGKGEVKIYNKPNKE
jgi:uncharacterized membrane protein